MDIIQLILENDTHTYLHYFNTTDSVEQYIKTVNFNDYSHTDIFFMSYGVIDVKKSKVYKKRFLNKH